MTAPPALLPWPVPALLTWALAWAVFFVLRSAEATAVVALLGGAVIGAVAAVCSPWPLSRWHQAFLAFGFPLSLLLSGTAGELPPWAWLLPLGVLSLLYPVRAWRDAPFFPTPPGALQGLSRLVPLGGGAAVLEAGCGLGDGLRALHAEYPGARLDGIEWSRPLGRLCRWRCRFARVSRGDLWAADWSGYALVYLFQRPESMPRAVAKAAAELPAGAWLASLEFEATELEPTGRHHVSGWADGLAVLPAVQEAGGLTF